MNLACRECGKPFVFTTGEQEFYKLKELTFPSRCPECRSSRKIQLNHQACTQCGTKFEKGASVYCTSCLASVHLEFELTGKQSEKALDETQSKLKTIEVQHARLTEALQLKEQLVTDLKQTVNSLKESLNETECAQDQLKILETEKAELSKSILEKNSRLTELEETVTSLNQELEKVQQLHVDMQWIQPAVNAVNSRLESLERGQNTTNQRMLQVVQKMHDMYENMDLWTLFKRSLSNIFLGQRTEREEQIATKK
jgi:chromosome segregation ATPase